MKNLELRTYNAELRQVEEPEKSPVLTGYAAVFNQESQALGFGFNEMLDPNCFQRSLEERTDICAFFNHDMSMLLGRTTSNTLTVRADDHGLNFDLQLPDTDDGNRCKELVKRGDLTGVSFGFAVREDRWLERKGMLPLRTLLEVELVEISPVVYPAYQGTEVALRSLKMYKAHQIDWLARIAVEELEMKRLESRHA